ncbi:hypothetical protein [Solimicrobium silvestre]|uniref:Uncharacterized protein n=1 Tax=Solimicrobium silvestre TaxID=2099400 RepID=A0A2S9GYK8_9BURK|nr:hypothetical protein [Solimicrobium silvestre]PRC92746.1 hypothetical protein S2091_2476 [Solimicrobium silvestre]
MKNMILQKITGIFLSTLATASAIASPCDGINRSINLQNKRFFAETITKQLKAQIPDVASVQILQYFAYKDWSVVYVNTQVSDEVFLIYHDSPLKGKYLDSLAGAYAANEEQSVYDHLINGDSKGIPTKLAKCIAWHITKDRD